MRANMAQIELHRSASCCPGLFVFTATVYIRPYSRSRFVCLINRSCNNNNRARVVYMPRSDLSGHEISFSLREFISGLWDYGIWVLGSGIRLYLGSEDGPDSPANRLVRAIAFQWPKWRIRWLFSDCSTGLNHSPWPIIVIIVMAEWRDHNTSNCTTVMLILNPYSKETCVGCASAGLYLRMWDAFWHPKQSVMVCPW